MKKLAIILGVAGLMLAGVPNAAQAGWAQQAKLIPIASDGAAKDCVGNSVSIMGDYAIVGAPGDMGPGEKDWWVGSAYIFHRSGTSWTQVDKLTASDGAVRDYFGERVSISGDTAIVGAPQGGDRGAAYIFQDDGSGNWIEKRKLLPSDRGTEDDAFACSVSISGDYAIVGAETKHEDPNDVFSKQIGAAYIYYRNEGGADGETMTTAALPVQRTSSRMMGLGGLRSPS